MATPPLQVYSLRLPSDRSGASSPGDSEEMTVVASMQQQ